jgi:hypothetical protein
MMMKRIILLSAGLLGTVAMAQQYELPAQSTREQRVQHTLFTLSYNEGYELASWAAYQLTPEQARATGTLPQQRIIRMPVLSWVSLCRLRICLHLNKQLMKPF